MSMAFFSRANLLVGLLYLLMLAAIVLALVGVRQRALSAFADEPSRRAWQQWRDEAARQAEGEGPVARRPPDVDEPPTLILLRDHFAAVLALSLVLSSVLFFTLAVMVRGVIGGPKFQPAAEDVPRDAGG